jgi:hypothetical protein
MSDALEQRLRRLEDLEAIRHLTAQYAHIVDKGYNGKGKLNGEALRPIFTKDATWTNAAFRAQAEGIDNIIVLLEKSTEAFAFAMHSFTNPVIEVDGDTAKATWLLWVAVNMGAGGNEVFQSEDLVYERTAEGWRIKTLDLHFGQFLNG